MHRHTRTQCLIGDKRLKLGEAPSVECCALRPSSPHPRANVRQIFDGNRPLCAFGLRNNLFGDHMVDVLGEAGFLPSKNPQTATTAQGAKPLQFVSEPPMAIAHVLDRAPAVDFPIAIDGNVRHTQIDAQRAFDINQIGIVNIDGGEQIPIAAHEGEVALAFTEWQQRFLMVAAHEGDSGPAVQCPDRHRRIRQGKREDAIIVGNRGCRAKCALGFRVQLVGVSDFRQDANSHLRSQSERFAHILIAQLLERELPKRARVPSDLANVVAGFVRPNQRAMQRIRLIGRGQEFQLYCKFHYSELYHGSNVCATIR